MGLKLIPENESVFLFVKGEVDSWGIPSKGAIKKEFGCLIRPTEDSSPIESVGGKQVIPSYDITFNGKVPVNVGDLLEVEGSAKVVLSKKESKDLSRNVLITKIKV